MDAISNINNIIRIIKVSIHAPVMDAMFIKLGFLLNRGVSIHAPVMDAIL